MRRQETVRLAFACLAAVACVSGQGAQEPKPLLAEEVFKNVQVLKGVPVDQFMDMMGVFSAALGMSCEDCHAANDSKWENYALDTSPRKLTARRMIGIMEGINKNYFGGRQMVTCHSCHRGSNRPKVTTNLGTLYGAPPDEEEEDIVQPARDAPPADQIFEKYLLALGGGEKLGLIRSFIAKGTSSGYGPESEKRPLEVYAKFPNQRTTIIHTANGDSTTTYDGHAGWISAPLRPVAVLALTGGELEGIRLDAVLGFPAEILQALGQWRVGRPVVINDRKAQVVQGNSSSGASFATLYFDAESGLLLRMIRYSNSRAGRSPTQFDYSDYREVSRVKVPFRWTMSWLDGRENVELSEVQLNVAIDAAKFAKPAAPVTPTR